MQVQQGMARLNKVGERFIFYVIKRIIQSGKKMFY